jgi:hypothetical protein
VFRVREKILRVVEQAGVQALELKALQGATQLVLQELRVDAVPAAVHILDHLRKRASRRLALLGQGEVPALNVADF